VQVFRIAKTGYVHDLSGTGAMLNGGRWNQKGIPLIYAAENRSLATLEYVVHVPLSIIPKNLSIACYETPDDIVPEEISVDDLPKKWRAYPSPSKLAELGSEWALANRSLLLRVPSAIVPSESNILINPKHPEITRITISHIEKYAIDKRLLRE
jgi:RES domain-containing protein